MSVRSSFRLKWPRCAFFGDFTSSSLLLLFPTAPPLRLALVSSHCYSGRVVLVAVEYGVNAKTISGRPSGEQEKPAQRDHHLLLIEIWLFPSQSVDTICRSVPPLVVNPSSTCERHQLRQSRRLRRLVWQCLACWSRLFKSDRRPCNTGRTSSLRLLAP